MLSLTVCALILLGRILHSDAGSGVTCRDNSGNPVDWLVYNASVSVLTEVSTNFTTEEFIILKSFGDLGGTKCCHF